MNENNFFSNSDTAAYNADIHYPMSDDDYEYLRMGLENSHEIDTAFTAVIDTLDDHLASMDSDERLFLSTQLATTIAGRALAGCFINHRYLLNQAVEKMAEATHHKAHIFLHKMEQGK